jgi:hypothetical protein
VKAGLRAWAAIVIVPLLGSIVASGNTHSAFVQGRLSKERLENIRAEAHAWQTDTTVSADLSQDSRGENQ